MCDYIFPENYCRLTRKQEEEALQRLHEPDDLDVDVRNEIVLSRLAWVFRVAQVDSFPTTLIDDAVQAMLLRLLEMLPNIRTVTGFRQVSSVARKALQEQWALDTKYVAGQNNDLSTVVDPRISSVLDQVIQREEQAKAFEFLESCDDRFVKVLEAYAYREPHTAVAKEHGMTRAEFNQQRREKMAELEYDDEHIELFVATTKAGTPAAVFCYGWKDVFAFITEIARNQEELFDGPMPAFDVADVYRDYYVHLGGTIYRTAPRTDTGAKAVTAIDLKGTT